MQPLVVKERHIPFLGHLGIDVLAFGSGRCQLQITPRPWHCNSLEVAHGGVIMTLLDAAMAIAGRAMFTDDYNDPVNCITIEMKTSFLAPARGRVLADGWCLKRGGSLLFCEAEARDEAGNLLARASGTFKPLLPKASVAS